MIQITFTLVLISFCTNVALNLFGFLKRKFHLWDVYIDGSHHMHDGRRVFGNSTTLDGLFICLAMSFGLICVTHEWIFFFFPLCVYAGHLVGSFIKRRVGKKDGQFLLFIDHADSITFVALVAYFGHFSSLNESILAIIITIMIQPLFTYIGFKLGLRESPL